MKNPLSPKAYRLGLPVPKAASRPVPAHREGKAVTPRVRAVDRLPRGTGVIRDQIDRKESARWARTDEVLDAELLPGNVILGKLDGRLIGSVDDKPLVTIASARSGKTATVLKPTLFEYAGSMVVLDPKGELAAATAVHRRDELKQKVYVVDPFGCSGLASASYNPLAELDPDADDCVDDVDAIAQALILSEGGEEGSHWTNSAEALIRGLVLMALARAPEERNLAVVRQLLLLRHPELVAQRDKAVREGDKNADTAVQNMLFLGMMQYGDRFGGALAGMGSSFMRKSDRERASVVSTAETQTKFLDSTPVQRTLKKSDFRMAELAERPTTIYLCLPAGRMQSHFRWLRLIVRMALMALEKRGTWERGRKPILFMMEEFATLGHMPIMEQAAAYFPGFGVRLWAVLQDITQLKRHYRHSWESFLGNAGVIQFFGNGDKDTLDYISDRLGSLSFVRGQIGQVGADDQRARDFIDKERLAYPHELAAAFARQTGAQLLMMHGKPPMAIERLSFEDVEEIRKEGSW